MELLYFLQEQELKVIQDSFYRFLYQEINWANRMIGIKGPRGAGKTTLLLQHLKYALKGTNALYTSLDQPYFYNNTLFDLAVEFWKNGGKTLLLDEVHKYPRWSRELKSIYDSFPELMIIFSSSSALDIFKGESDLSRRVSIYELPGMSFREFLAFRHQHFFDSYSLDTIVQSHQEISAVINQQIRPLPLFKAYLEAGYLPFAKELGKIEYLKRLNNIVNTVLESDLATIEGYSAANTQKIKRLLGILAEIVPYEPNIASLARNLSIGRDTVMEYLNHLEKAQLLNFLSSGKKGMSKLRKPSKILLENPNLSYSLHPNPDIGSIRETFAVSQFFNAGCSLSIPERGDLWVDEQWTFEIGGKNKTYQQIADLPQAYLLKDNIETGFMKTIPLWLMGFLY